ncbi:tyrosine-protein kinase receptor Tie-1-like [Oculina patagonica]
MCFVNLLRIPTIGCTFLLLLLLPRAESVLKFTLEPSDPSFARNGSNAKLVWDYSVDDKQAELAAIIYSVQVSRGTFRDMLVQVNDGTVIDSSTIPASYKGRVRIVGKATLVIENITHQDNTIFQCKLLANLVLQADQRSTVHLIVTVAPQLITSSVKASYNEGSTVNISCTASGTPDPDVQWNRNGKVKSSGKKTAFMAFNNISRADDGLYTCRANNSAGTDEHHVTLVVRYAPTIQQATASAAKSWIGQTVKLKCVSDGIPTPTLTWYKSNASQIIISSVTATQNTVNVKMEVDQDFGDFKCGADNGLIPADYKIVKVQQIKKPGSPTITLSDIQATSLTVKWTAPADDGGSPITAYRVVILKGDTEIKNENVTDPGTTSLSVGGLERDTKYTVKVFTRNAVFEGPAGEEALKTKYEGVPATATIDDLPSEVTDNAITLKWNEPQDNGKVITQYTVYQRVVTDGKPGEWIKLKTTTDVSVRELKVELKQGNVYEFVVTATNELGESLKDDGKIKRVKASGGSSCNETILHIVYAIVIVLLLIVILILTIVLRRMHSRTGIPKTNRTNICAGCGGELVVLNTIATETDKQSSSKAPSGDSGKTYALPSSGNYMPLHPSARRWEINREQVKIIKIIGKGAFGEVAKATAWNISGNEEYTTVAVKMLKANAPDSDRKDLLAEVELMKKLKPHPHVIKLLACVTETDPLLVVIEYVPFGDLLGYLRKSRGLNDTYFKDPDVKPQTSLTAEQLMRFAWQIADGMFYLSSKKIIHRDLAARNVLVGEGEKCKVTDFGMARNVHQDDIYTRQSRGRLPVKWTAYEALLYGTYTTQSDVWSYGVLLYEILTVGGSPYPGIQAQQIARKLQEGFRMPKPKHVDNKLYQIMLKCWEENPSNRPTFAELKDTMKEMEKNHKTYVNLKHYDKSLYANVEDLTVD